MRLASKIGGGVLAALALVLFAASVMSANEIGRGPGGPPVTLAMVAVVPIPKEAAAAIPPASPEPAPANTGTPAPQNGAVAAARVDPAPPNVAQPQPPVKPRPPKLAEDAGSLNLKADFPAEIYVDGKKVGNTLLRGYRVNPGVHKVRFDCNTDGRKVQGTPRTVRVEPFMDVDVKHECPVAAKLRD